MIECHRRAAEAHLGPRTIAAVVCAALFLHARPADAVIVLLKGQSEPVRGYLVRQDDSAVVLRELQGDDQTVERTIPRSEIQDVIISVSAERLAALQRDKPDRYREYAEELAEKRKDPDAEATAIRLFLIAAYLDPEKLGRSCLLGMVSLARNDAEQRRFRAMSYLLDPAHDANLLKVTPSAAPPPKEDLDPRQLQFMLRALRLLRQDKKREAQMQARRSKLEQQLPLLTDKITYKEFEEACEPICRHCKRGDILCPTCKGKRVLGSPFASNQPCVACGASGKQTCPHCLGNYQTNPLPDSLLKRIVQVELDWLPQGGAKEEAAPPLVRPPWSRAAASTPSSVKPLTLESLTEFDPRQCHYRDGQWTE